MKKLRKGVKQFIFLFLFVLFCVISYFGYQLYLKEKELRSIEEIRSHYASYVSLKKGANVYQKLDSSFSVIGTVVDDVSVRLESVSITDSTQNYFSVLDSEYYFYYEDVIPVESENFHSIKDYYVPLSKTISTLGNMTFYQNGKETFTILKPLEIPVLYADDIFYYVEFWNDIFGVKRETVEVKEERFQGEEATFLPVLNFVSEKEECSASTCITTEKEKEFLKNLQDNQRYTISESEYSSWLKGDLRLKPGAIFLAFDQIDEQRRQLFSQYGFEVGVSLQMKFIDNNQTTKQGTDINSVNRYVIHQNTTENHMKQVMNGEPIVIEKQKTNSSVKGLPDIDAKATHIAVLNYHFFYDSSANEICNEGNCLDVKNFREQLDYLKEHQYKTLTMEEYRAWMYGEIELPARSVLLTIDDGAMGTGNHNGNKLIPLLEEYQMHATLFLISGWWSVDHYQSEYLDIESHTYDMHQEKVCKDQMRGAKMLCSSKEEVLNDLRLSIQRIGHSTAFCFPFYAFHDSAIQCLKEVGFQLAFIGGSHKSSRNNDKYKIPRFPIHKTTTMEQFLNMIH